MNNTQKFIKLAIEGGYTAQHYTQFLHHSGYRIAFGEHILLDPLAWQAVGKVEGWDTLVWVSSWEFENRDKKYEQWQWNMHRMIDALCEGKTIEQALGEILA